MVKTTSETRPGPSPGPAKNVARREHMFIEVSGNGPTARPPKEVRSFVMRGARVQTNWSTRQKRPDAKPDQKPANTARNKKRGSSRRVSSASPRSGHEAAPSPEGLSTQHSGSPVSIASDSLTTTRSLSLPIFTTQSTPTTLCRFPGCNGFFCGMPPEAHAVSWDGFSVGFAADLDCLPVKADDKMRGLLRNFVNVYSTLLIPLDRHQSSKSATTQWVRNGIQNDTGAPFIYALTTCSALYPQATTSYDPYDVQRYKYKAIKAVNRLFQSKIQERKIDDNNIAAVFMILNLVESQVANPDQQASDWSDNERKMHLEGLTAMIKQRGGLSALANNQCLQTFILMHTIAHTILTFERSYAPLLDSSGHIQSYDIPSSRAPSFFEPTLRLFEGLCLPKDLREIITDVVIFTGELDDWAHDRCSVGVLELQKHVALLVYRLFDWFKKGEERQANGVKQGAVNPVAQSICLALMIFLIIGYNTHYQVLVPTAALKLRFALGKCLILWGNASHNPLFLWTLTMGALATQGTDQFPFFRTCYEQVLLGRNIEASLTTPEDIRRLLTDCPWLPKLDHEVSMLWPNMEFGCGDEIVDSVESEAGSPESIQTEYAVGRLTGARFFQKSESAEPVKVSP